MSRTITLAKAGGPEVLDYVEAEPLGAEYHGGTCGLLGGAEGIRTDGHRGFPAANRGISPANLKGDERQTRLRKATQP